MLEKIKQKISESKIQLSIFIVLVVVFAIFIIGNPRTFLSYRIYYAFMSTIPFSAILALSLTPVVILREIDLSFPSVMGFCAWLFSFVFNQTNNIYLAFVICLAVGLFAGFINSVLIVRVGIPSLILTIGMMFMWRGLVYIASGGRGLSMVGTKGTVLYKVLVGRIGGLVPAQAIWAVVIAIVFALILNRHRFGAHILYTGDDAVSAKMMGVNVAKVKTIVFMQLGVFAAFVGALATLEVLYLWPSTGEGYLMKSLASVFIGGTSVFGGMGTIFGTFAGAIIMGSLEAGIVSGGISGFWTQFVFGIVIVLSLTIYAYMNKRVNLSGRLKRFIKALFGKEKK
ncbi:MAG: sugar ABC transporter permease [Actinobacteria bacterium RBG_19FT_COMBO_36_27]|nr:MAG: sugar ABC transporter permease [Actinobacteria bacterium RBG_19FT_COMBO_36_27]